MKHFSLDEFKCSCGCGRHVDKMDKKFMDKLDMARDGAESPFIITSGYRCPTHNMTVGGSVHSSHLKGCAVDIRCHTSRERFDIIAALLYEGFTRIGIGDGFIHVDYDWRKPTEVIWDYYK